MSVGSTSGEVLRWDPRAKSWGALGKPLFAVPGRGVNHVRALCEGSGRWLYAGSCTGERARIHLDTAEIQKLPEPAEQGNWYVSAVAALPDGRIAFGFGHVARILVYDPAKGKDIGQWLPQGWTEDGFCLNLLAGRSVLYASHFPRGRRAAFDTATGRFLGQRVYRPYNTCVAEDGKIWSVGPAGWGTTGGGVGSADPVALRTAATALPEAPHDVVPVSGKRLLVCSSGLLRWWDGTGNRELAQAPSPFPLVSATLIDKGPPGRVLLASGQELAVGCADEAGRLTIQARHRSPVPCARALVWSGRAVVGGASGFAVVDLQTGAARPFCHTPLGHRWAYTIAADAVFFHSGTHLITAAIPAR